MTADPEPRTTDRRRLLRTAAIGAGAAWAAPTILSATPAAAQASPQPGLILDVVVTCTQDGFTVVTTYAQAAVGLFTNWVTTGDRPTPTSYCSYFPAASISGTSSSFGFGVGFEAVTSVEMQVVDAACALIESSGPVAVSCQPPPGLPVDGAPIGRADVAPVLHVDAAGNVTVTRG